MTDREKVEREERYNHRELPPVKNWLLYTYRAFIKLFFYAFFGTGSVFLAIFVFPWIRVFVHPRWKFQTAARAYVSRTFRFFVNFMRAVGAVSLKVSDREQFRNIHSKVIVANHPSILDFVFIMSMVPNANCIVRGGLTKTVLAGVIKQAYIVNSLDFDELCRLCKQTLDDGNNVIIFPEGTRTPRHGSNPYKKGAARIAYYAGCDVQPVFVGGNDKYGLGKHDPFWSYNHTEKYVYDFKLLPEIKIADYQNLTETIAAKRLTEKMQETLGAASAENDLHYITNRDKPSEA
ncbi:MAG: 1-acyl-sn-glycerol-3-phosphate acyltransferase [Treponemataceae bacterium]|nr:1-acyl-sn-glycerol-3-phosphate acyltransferase [Treponemataceae bacterium]